MYKRHLLVLALLMFMKVNSFGQKRSDSVPPPPPPTLHPNATNKKSELTDEKIFTKVDIESSYPGGDKAWNKFLGGHLNGSVPFERGCPPGHYHVLVKFLIDKEGNIADISAESNLGFGMEQEVIRVIKLSSKWIPAEQNGKKVASYKRQPITFVVEEEKKTRRN